jgi:hypothetical protein
MLKLDDFFTVKEGKPTRERARGDRAEATRAPTTVEDLAGKP